MTAELLHKAEEIYHQIRSNQRNIEFLQNAEYIELKKDDPLFEEVRLKKIEQTKEQIALLEEQFNQL